MSGEKLLDLSCLPGASLNEIALSQQRLVFVFTLPSVPPKIPNGISIGVDGKWELRNPEGRVLDHSQKHEERSEYRLHLLLGKTVRDVVGASLSKLELVFQDGQVLRIFDQE